MSNDEKINDILERLEKLENVVFNKKSKKIINNNGKYEGLSGGIQLLIDNSFFNTPRNVPEIVSELKRNISLSNGVSPSCIV